MAKKTTNKKISEPIDDELKVEEPKNSNLVAKCDFLWFKAKEVIPVEKYSKEDIAKWKSDGFI